MDEQTFVAPELMGLMPRAPDDHLDLPDPVNGPYFIALKDGFHMVKSTHWGKTMLPVKEVPTLPEYKASSILWYPEQRIQTDMLAQIWGFFAQVFKDIQSEAMVYLTHKNGEYRVFVPPQKVTKVAVKATFNPADIGDWQVVGTIHSHCDFSAYHSGTDMHDADGMDGLHITLGNVNLAQPSIAIMISVNKIKWDLKPDEILSDGMPKHPTPHPVWWHRYVEKDVPVTHVTNYNGGYQNGNYQNKATTAPPPQAPAGRGKKGKPRNNSGLEAGKGKGKPAPTGPKNGLKDVKIDEIDSIENVFDELRSYKMWGDKFTDTELDIAFDYLQSKWEDLTSDLAGVGIWAEIGATPLWNLTKRFDVNDARNEMAEVVSAALKAIKAMHSDEVKSTDEREWLQYSPSITDKERDELVALMGGD